MTYKLQVSIKKKEINLQVAIWFLRDAALKGEIYEFQIELYELHDCFISLN